MHERHRLSAETLEEASAAANVLVRRLLQVSDAAAEHGVCLQLLLHIRVELRATGTASKHGLHLEGRGGRCIAAMTTAAAAAAAAAAVLQPIRQASTPMAGINRLSWRAPTRASALVGALGCKKCRSGNLKEVSRIQNLLPPSALGGNKFWMRAACPRSEPRSQVKS